MARTLYTYIGAGQVYLRRLDTSFGLLPVGDAETLNLAVETEDITKQQHSQTGGGNLDKVTRVTKVGVTLALSELSPENVALAMYGSASAVSVTPVVDEDQVAYTGALVKFNNAPDTSVAYVVKNDAGDTTYVKDTDYTVSALGITMITGGGITSGDTIKVSYTPMASDVVELLSNSGYSYELVFEGLNEANGGKAQPIDLYRVKFSPAADLGLITDEFGSLTVEGEALVDSAITGAGLSRFGKIWIPTA